MITRFAPSPTGQLHLGHLYAALFARDLAAKHGGRFLLRYEDIDATRVRDAYYTQIEEDLHWAGVKWHEPVVRQTSRLSSYQAAMEKLKSLGVVYPCFCTRKGIQRELDNLTRAPHGPDGPLYPGICKQLTQHKIDTNILNGSEPSWRLDSEKAQELTGPLSFSDGRLGKQQVIHHLLGDVVLSRKDIGTSYHIAVVVDDAFQNVTDVTRGKDLLESTHIHRILQSLLDLPEPHYYHHDLVCDSHGKRLAKRDNALAIKQLRSDGETLATLQAYIEKNCC
ncbi:MAG: tRNA glutamyl-Q(34) synthetase GluQRS [Rubritalea sp.]|uniref:tRNA glutamyl-Q(34) synthetase GluQRS n=1 Tax=Rubritalea sp. TaxID=2109375 RepID=UPI003241D77E